jgi:DNA gyrase subunit A
VVRNRLSHDLDQIEKRLHILEGFERVFDALDEIIRIIRGSDSRADAASKIMKKFDLDEVQTDAILELRLYRLAKLEILVIRKEAEEKRKEQKRLQGLLKSPTKRWKLIEQEMEALLERYADRRRTKIVGADKEVSFSEADFIVDEDAYVILTERGWVKRQGTVRDLGSTRVKEGDRVVACEAGSTRSSLAFFSSRGGCYVSRIADVPASTGYGDPLQKLFKLGDGERIVAMASLDPRIAPIPEEEEVYEDGTPCPPYGVAVTRKGLALRFPLWPHREPSTRAGRRFAKLKDGDEVVEVFIQREEDAGWVLVATDDGHGLAVDVEELAVLAGPGRGTQLVKLAAGAEVLAVRFVSDDTPLFVRTEAGKRYALKAPDLEGPRASRGRAVVKRSGFAAAEPWEPEVPELPEWDEEG